jgi:hypothetical protein
MRPDREAGLYGSLFRAGGEFSGFNFASFPSALISFHVVSLGSRNGGAAWGLAFQNYSQHKLLTSLRRSARGLYGLDFVSHAARMMLSTSSWRRAIFSSMASSPHFSSSMSRYLDG